MTEQQDAWFLIADSAGHVTAQGIIPLDCKKQFTKGVNVSEQGLLIGLVDAKTLKGRIVRLDREGNATYTALGNSSVFQYVPTGEGGLIAHSQDETLCAPQIISVDEKGTVCYDIIGKPIESRFDQGTLSFSLIGEKDRRAYVLEVQGTSKGSGTREELICYDANEKEAWRTAIPNGENLWIHDLMIDGDNVYLVGYIGEWESPYVLGNRKGLVLCYSTDGMQQWARIVSEVQEFRYGGAGRGLCVAGQMVDNRWKFLVMSDQGQEVYWDDFEAENCYIQKYT